ncbi:MAG TPA: RseA family anti-sigma factor [Thermomonas sp.]|nr:RseA family anti-sigma factor [Thermomonas sp.]
MTHDTTLHANTLTQLSSREQLSALMDGALPPNETRFLLRRLQHDVPLAECWERWRLGGEVMRGLAPAQRLPADFATRVALALQQDGQPAAAVAPRERKPGWLRWGGGAAMAASLAVVVGFIARQPVVEAPGIAPQTQVAAASTVADPAPAPSLPDPAAPSLPTASDTLVAATATAIAAASRPQRSRDNARRAQVAPAPASPVESIAAANPPISAPQPDIVTRPWPRSVLPQYAGNNALAVGFGDHARAAPYNPFQSPALAEIAPPATGQAAAPVDAPAGAASEP